MMIIIIIQTDKTGGIVFSFVESDEYDLSFTLSKYITKGEYNY